MTKETFQPFVWRFPMCMPQYTLERQDVLNLSHHTLAQLPLSPVAIKSRSLTCSMSWSLPPPLGFPSTKRVRTLEMRPLGKPFWGNSSISSTTWISSKTPSIRLLARLVPKEFGQTGTPSGYRFDRTALSWHR